MSVETYQLELQDAGWLVANVKCADACPVSTRAGRYIALMAKGKFEEAYWYARMPNPFASTCGRICAHPCEGACNRGLMDKPLAIRALKRFLTERYGVESPRMLDLRARLGLKPASSKGKKVAIVGAGPAGLACAHDLAIMGYSPEIFEASPVGGGMLRLGVPEYRLSRQLLQREIDFIANLGVEIHYNTKIGEDISLQDLRQDYQALFIACGAQMARDLPIKGNDLDGVFKGIDFLREINLGRTVSLGQTVVVIGGGNVAFDVARSAVRRATSGESDPGSATHEVLDVARAARFFGAEVHVVCLEPRSGMLADEEEVEAANDEGVFLHTSTGPDEIIGEGDKVVGLITRAVKSIFDEDGRFNPTFHEGSEVIKADTVILAIGQAIDTTFIGPKDGVELNPNATIKVDPQTMATSVDNIFAGGDSAFGPRSLINAVSDGRTAAESIHSHLSGQPRPKKLVEYSAVHRRQYSPRGDYDGRERASLPMTPIEHRIGIVEIELALDESSARYEAGRCLHCFYNVSINPDNCILCGRCAEACPMECIKMVSFDRVEADSVEREYIEKTQPKFFTAGGNSQQAVAMIQDEQACIRCGQCVAACPADACTMMRIELDEGGATAIESESIKYEGVV